MHDTIRTEVTVASPVEPVWAALTEPDQVGTWFGNGRPARIDLRPGGLVVFDHGHGDLPAVVEAVDVGSRLAYRWAIVGPAGTEPTSSNSTLVDLRLSADGDGTRVDLTESGFTAVTDDPEQAAQQYENNVAGWPRILDSLRRHVEA